MAEKLHWTEDLLEHQDWMSTESMWLVEKSEVRRVFKENIDTMRGMVMSWLKKRDMFFDLHEFRQDEYLILALGEVDELVGAVVSKKHEFEQQNEWGDVMTYLLYRDEIEVEIEDEFLDEIDFGEEPLEWIKELPGELAVWAVVDNTIKSIEALKEKDLDEAVFGDGVRFFMFRAFNAMIRYALARDWDVIEVLRETLEDNSMNLPESFFCDRLSPFKSKTMAYGAVKILQLHGGFENKLGFEVWQQVFKHNLWFIAGHSDDKELRRWVFNELERIYVDESVPEGDRELIPVIVSDLVEKQMGL